MIYYISGDFWKGVVLEKIVDSRNLQGENQ